jgi:hypothetical protein
MLEFVIDSLTPASALTSCPADAAVLFWKVQESSDTMARSEAATAAPMLALLLLK